MLQAMVIIPTAMGNAVRPQSDLLVSDSVVSLRPEASCCLLPSGTPLDQEALSVVMYMDSDLPDPCRVRSEICNVCGYVAGFSTLGEHPAWRTVRSTLGRFREAYSLRGGNLLFLRGKLIFKGATDRAGVYATVTRMLAEPLEPTLKAYLIIATAYMRRNLFVNSGCLLEEMLERFAWCRVVGRYAGINGALRERAYAMVGGLDRPVRAGEVRICLGPCVRSTLLWSNADGRVLQVHHADLPGGETGQVLLLAGQRL